MEDTFDGMVQLLIQLWFENIQVSKNDLVCC